MPFMYYNFDRKVSVLYLYHYSPAKSVPWLIWLKTGTYGTFFFFIMS